MFYDTVPASPSGTSAYVINMDNTPLTPVGIVATLQNSCETINYSDSSGVVIKAFYKYHVQVSMYHQYSNVFKVTLISKLTSPSTLSSFGFNNLKLYSASSIPVTSSIPIANFPCSVNNYWTGTNCASCHSYCSVCTGTSNNQCTACRDGNYNYNNGTCLDTCAGPFTQVKTNGGNPYYCNVTCENDFYWFYNGSCSTTCDAPLTQSVDPNGLKICSNPCYYNDAGLSYVNNYLYPDSSCVSSCDPPLRARTPNVCMSPCENFDDYYFTNGTCSSICPFPLEGKTEAGIKYCYNPCTANGTYLYDNGTCLPTCPSPNILRTKSMGEFCNFPCSNTALYFYSSDGSCQAKCVYPNSAVEFPLPKTCSLGLSQDEAEEVKKLSGVTGTTESVSSGGILFLSLLSSSDSTSVCMGPFSKMLSYIRYMDIVYPAKVVLMLESQSNDSNTRGFSSKMIGGILDSFPETELPEKFEEYGTLSSFFVNFWPALFNLLAILIGTFVVMMVNGLSKGCFRLNKIVKGLEELLKWNALLITFCGNFGDIFLFTALEFHTTKWSNIQGPISFGLCLVINFFVLFVVIRILEINFEVRKSRKQFQQENLEEQEGQLAKEWSSWSAFFAAYKGQSYYQQIFLFIFLARLAFFGSVIGYLYEYPLAQAILINIANVAILLYLGIKRPMKQIASFIQQMTLELVLLPFNLCVLILAILDAKGIDAYEERNKIGSVMVYINVITPILSVILMAIKFIFIGISVYQQWKAQKKKALKTNVIVKRVKRDNVSLAMGSLPQKIQKRIPQNMNNQQVFRQIPSGIEGSGSSVLDISSASLKHGSSMINNSDNSFVFHQTGSPRRQQQQAIPGSKKSSFL